MGIGRTVHSGIGMGYPVRASFDGNPRWKAGGATLAWGTVAALGADLTLPGGLIVPAGRKLLRYGQALTKITTAHAQTVTVSGTPTGGTFTYLIIDPTTGATYPVTVPYNASTATHQTAINTAIGSSRITVSGAGALPGNVHTLTLGGHWLRLILPLLALVSNDFTGGTAPTAAFAVSAGADSGKFGPYDDQATDGRQTILQGEVFIVDSTIIRGNVVNANLPGGNTDQVGVIEGGRVRRENILANDSAGSLAAGPTFAALQAAMPSIEFVRN